LRKTGERSLSHLRARDTNDDRIVGLHDDPRVDLLWHGRLRRSNARERNVEADDEASGGRRGRAEELTP
jgi:hypothetical protein